jgi:transposase
MDGRQIDRLDVSADRERLEREQRNHSPKKHGSNNWEKQRQTVAEVHKQMRNKKQDFKKRPRRIPRPSENRRFSAFANLRFASTPWAGLKPTLSDTNHVVLTTSTVY